MKKIYKIGTALTFLLIIAAVFAPDLAAQCPMCKMSAEQNLKAGGSAGAGLNAGILYMFAMPYLIVGTLGYLWYKNRKSLEKEDVTDEIRSISNEII